VLHHHNDIVAHLGSGVVEDDESAVILERLVFRLPTPVPAAGSVPHGID
jgi:hypothetical protein